MGGWYGFDCDGTLAKNDGPEYERGEIGKPVPRMMKLLRDHLDKGDEVRIVTARADTQEGIDLVKDWLEDNDLPPLEVTTEKDHKMIRLYDDRAVGVVPNEGILLTEPKKKSSKILKRRLTTV
jgi:FMN phosphatase YigB (HAD superfamily)